MILFHPHMHSYYYNLYIDTLFNVVVYVCTLVGSPVGDFLSVLLQYSHTVSFMNGMKSRGVVQLSLEVIAVACMLS